MSGAIVCEGKILRWEASSAFRKLGSTGAGCGYTPVDGSILEP
jgi:hypothetical protein